MSIDLLEGAIDGYTTDQEVIDLCKLASGLHTVIEVGAFMGRVTKALCKVVTGKVIVVDNFVGAPTDPVWTVPGLDIFKANLAPEIRAGKVDIYAMSSADAAAQLQQKGVQADLIFIDADHTFSGVTSDIDSYLPLVKPGGTLCGHDYTEPNWPDVKKAVDARLGKVKTISKRAEHESRYGNIWVYRT